MATTKTDTQNDNYVPRHVGIILDGNRRWAKARNLPGVEGHRQGAEALKTVVRTAFDRGVEYVTAYVFSTENWKRAEEEVSFLMNMLLKFVEKDMDTLHKENIRVVILGSREGLSDKVQEALDRIETKTAGNTRGTMALCFNYGGQMEIIDAVKSIVASGLKAGEVTLDTLSASMYHPDIPSLDLIIRTSGEQRLSNFMLWRSTYAELLFIDKFWPDFGAEDVDAALATYAGRQRRFGK
jgi:undecaprenyl diphosphate synthase